MVSVRRRVRRWRRRRFEDGRGAVWSVIGLVVLAIAAVTLVVLAVHRNG